MENYKLHMRNVFVVEFKNFPFQRTHLGERPIDMVILAKNSDSDLISISSCIN